jgi:hypothetical protein
MSQPNLSLVSARMPLRVCAFVDGGLDMVRLARSNSCDAVVLFSQDGDLVEAVAEVQAIDVEQHRYVAVECAFPAAANISSWPIKMAIPRPISKAIYDSCIDHTDYKL